MICMQVQRSAREGGPQGKEGCGSSERDRRGAERAIGRKDPSNLLKVGREEKGRWYILRKVEKKRGKPGRQEEWVKVGKAYLHRLRERVLFGLRGRSRDELLPLLPPLERGQALEKN